MDASLAGWQGCVNVGLVVGGRELSRFCPERWVIPLGLPQGVWSQFVFYSKNVLPQSIVHKPILRKESMSRRLLLRIAHHAGIVRAEIHDERIARLEMAIGEAASLILMVLGSMWVSQSG